MLSSGKIKHSSPILRPTNSKMDFKYFEGGIYHIELSSAEDKYVTRIFLID